MRRTASFHIHSCSRSALAAPVLAQKAEYTPDVANCGDPSYENAVKNGITLGSNDNPPEFYQDANKEPAGIDWEINKAVLDLLGIKKINIDWMPWESVIPSLLSKRIDVIAARHPRQPRAREGHQLLRPGLVVWAGRDRAEGQPAEDYDL